MNRAGKAGRNLNIPLVEPPTPLKPLMIQIMNKTLITAINMTKPINSSH